jgi:hypothetical protein
MYTVMESNVQKETITCLSQDRDVTISNISVMILSCHTFLFASLELLSTVYIGSDHRQDHLFVMSHNVTHEPNS